MTQLGRLIARVAGLIGSMAALTALFAVAPLLAQSACIGDADGDGKVTVDEVVTTVNEALAGCSPVSASPFYQVEEAIVVPAQGALRKRIPCNPGDVVTGGGYFLNSADLTDDQLNVEVFANAPIISIDVPIVGPGWDVGIQNKAAIERSGFGYAICARQPH